MLKKLNQYYLNQQFNPGIAGIFINPFYFIRKGLYRAIKKRAPLLKGRILDFGCGSKPWQNLFVNASEYIGLDMDNPGHSHEKETIDVFYDGKQIPFDDRSFDAVFCSEVLEHVPNLPETLGELNRILKPGGLMLITVPFFWMEHEMPHDYRRFTQNGITVILEQNGFMVSEIETISHFTESLFQMNCMFVYSYFQSLNKFLRMVLTFLFISPLIIAGLIFSCIFPRNKRLYLGICVLAQKPDDVQIGKK